MVDAYVCEATAGRSRKERRGEEARASGEVVLTAHAKVRASQRGVSRHLVVWVYRNGRLLRAPGGAEFIFLGRKELRWSQERDKQFGRRRYWFDPRKAANLC